MSCDFSRLEALADGAADADETAALEAHLAACAACRDELAWLRAEAELMRRRREAQPPLRPELWQGISKRLAKPVAPPQSRAVRWQRLAQTGLCAAAAAALLLVLTHQNTQPTRTDSHDPALLTRAPAKRTPATVLDGAEREYSEALAVLRAEYMKSRDRLPPSVAARYDQLFGGPSCTVHRGSEADVNGRVLALDGYATCLSSLEHIVADLQVRP